MNETNNNKEYEKKISSAKQEATSLWKEYQAQDTYRVQLEVEVRMTKSSENQTETITFNFLLDGRNTGIAFAFLFSY